MLRGEPILAVEHLSRSFHGKSGTVDAVRDISFQIYSGECVGLIGESGSGKSTAANLIAGLLEPDAGTICFMGKMLTGRRPKEQRLLRRDMRMIFQNPLSSFNPGYRIVDNVAEGLLYCGKMRRNDRYARAQEALEICGLDKEYGKKYAWQLSGGECQRAAIARALLTWHPEECGGKWNGISGPRLLICDEATSALDVSVQKQILDLLKNLRERMQMSCLFISHDLAVVSQFCQRVMVMRSGEIVEQGDVSDLIQKPEHEYTRMLLDSVLTVNRGPIEGYEKP